MKAINFNSCKIDQQKGTQYRLLILDVTFWISNHHPEYGWFRIFGIGLNWIDEKRGIKFKFKIGKWRFRYLS